MTYAYTLSWLFLVMSCTSICAWAVILKHIFFFMIVGLRWVFSFAFFLHSLVSMIDRELHEPQFNVAEKNVIWMKICVSQCTASA